MSHEESLDPFSEADDVLCLAGIVLYSLNLARKRDSEKYIYKKDLV